MRFRIEPEMDGPDYTGNINVILTLDMDETRRLFGHTGDVLERIEANSDPS